MDRRRIIKACKIKIRDDAEAGDVEAIRQISTPENYLEAIKKCMPKFEKDLRREFGTTTAQQRGLEGILDPRLITTKEREIRELAKAAEGGLILESTKKKVEAWRKAGVTKKEAKVKKREEELLYLKDEKLRKKYKYNTDLLVGKERKQQLKELRQHSDYNKRIDTELIPEQKQIKEKIRIIKKAQADHKIESRDKYLEKLRFNTNPGEKLPDEKKAKEFYDKVLHKHTTKSTNTLEALEKKAESIGSKISDSQNIASTASDILGKTSSNVTGFLIVIAIIIVLAIITLGVIITLVGAIWGMALILKNNPKVNGLARGYMMIYGFATGWLYVIYSGFKHGIGSLVT